MRGDGVSAQTSENNLHAPLEWAWIQHPSGPSRREGPEMGLRGMNSAEGQAVMSGRARQQLPPDIPPHLGGSRGSEVNSSLKYARACSGAARFTSAPIGKRDDGAWLQDAHDVLWHSAWTESSLRTRTCRRAASRLQSEPRFRSVLWIFHSVESDLKLSSPLELNKHFPSVEDLQTPSVHAALSPWTRLSCRGTLVLTAALAWFCRF